MQAVAAKFSGYAEKQLTGSGPQGCNENGPRAAHFDRNKVPVISGRGNWGVEGTVKGGVIHTFCHT